MDPWSYFYFGHLSIIRTFSFSHLILEVNSFRISFSFFLKILWLKNGPTFLEFGIETSRALERGRQVRIFLWRPLFVPFSCTSFIYLLWVQQIRSCLRSGVRNHLMLLISWVVNLISIDYMSLFFPTFFLLFIGLIWFVDDPDSILNSHHLHFQTRNQ